MLKLKGGRKARNQRANRRAGETASGLSRLLGRKDARPGGATPSAQGRDWGRIRINVVVGLFCLFWAVLWGRAWYLQVLQGAYLSQRAQRQHMSSELVSGRRGEILDRNGQVLARSVDSLSVYARPHQISDPVRVANALAPVLGMDAQKLYERLSASSRKFIWLARKVDDKTAAAVRQAALHGVGLSKEYSRVYPFKSMAGHLLGFVDMDGKGREGLERSLDTQLSAVPMRQVVQRDAMGRRFYLHSEGTDDPSGSDVQLTLDVQIQFFAEEALSKAVEEHKAAWGGVLVVEVESGDIVAWAQYPFFNPNNYQNYRPAQYRNRLALDALEPGSTFKPFLMAAALQEKKISRDTPINCEGGRWTNSGVTIRDTSTRGVIPAHKVIRYSSNIGMAKIGLMMGSKLSYSYLRALGFGQVTEVPVAQTRGLLRPLREWNDPDLMSTWFGQSISVTGLQMAQAYLTLLNGGQYKALRLVRGWEGDGDIAAGHARRVYDASACRQVISMMRDVVEEDGSGKRARIEGIHVGGKTGTAQKADKKRGAYGDKRLASFVGFLPVEKPKYLILTMVDEPASGQFGGVVAAPVFQQIAVNTMTYIGQMAAGRSAPEDVSGKKEKGGSSRRGLKLARDEHRFSEDSGERRAPDELRVEGHLARAAARVPNVVGKSVRSAVELFARGGIVPVLKGEGQRVIRQSPAPGSAWPEPEGQQECVLWLSEK
ncbi:MAG: penicillin-binding transpeptidase domain-containing protein [Desulfovibrionaceae bacterium]|nr:penicillin-binding transpeptidase domain-containing protein [Desulfovibrionaceae bacterium]